MSIKFNLHNNYKVILLLALAIGSALSYSEIAQLLESNIVPPDSRDYFIAASRLVFFTVLAGLLLYIGTRPLKKHENLRHLAFSLALVMGFSLFPWLMIDPVSRESNQRHSEIYDNYYKDNRSKEKNEDRNEKRRLRDDRHHREHYFHEKGEDWIGTSLLLLLLIYGCTRIYNMSRREDEMQRQMESLRNESLQSRISALNNQINPHFFFNALNALHSLITEDSKDKSLRYLKALSEVFRYILQSEKKDQVTLAEEFAFLNTYRFMLTVKYAEKLTIDTCVDPKYQRYRLPVLSLLPLVENVIKHNEISRKYPMTVHIFVDENENLVIRNEKREKIDPAESAGIGLKNLNNRFRLLVGKEITIENQPGTFTVRLPLYNDNI